MGCPLGRLSGDCATRGYDTSDENRASTVHDDALRASPLPFEVGGPPDARREAARALDESHGRTRIGSAGCGPDAGVVRYRKRL